MSNNNDTSPETPEQGTTPPQDLYSAIPTYLRDRKEWLLWRYEQRKGAKKRTKVPYQPNGKHAKSNDPATWNDFTTCVKALQTGKFDGIGYVFADNQFGIDLDNCVDADGNPEPWAAETINQFSTTYIESSPSRTGFHIVGFGHPLKTGSKKWKKPGTNDEQGIEIYDRSSPRYFTFTSEAVNKQGVTDCQDALEWLYQEYFSEHHDEPKQARNNEGHVDVGLVCEALNHIPPDDYATWIQVGMTLKAAGLDFVIWDDWSSNSDKYTHDACVEKWATFKGNRIGLGTVFYVARQYGFRFPASLGGNLSLDDIGNAERLLRMFGQDVRWVQAMGWLVWTGTHWEIDIQDKVLGLAKKVARSIVTEAKTDV